MYYEPKMEKESEFLPDGYSSGKLKNPKMLGMEVFELSYRQIFFICT